MRFRQLLLVALAAGLVLGVAGCDDDDDTPTAPVAKNYFSIEIDAASGPFKAPTLDCDFAMGLGGALPEVRFNGVAIEAFGSEGAMVHGSVEIPEAASVDWEVRRGDQVVSGTIAVPEAPTTVTCNGTELTQNTGNTLAPADAYAFAWTGGTAGHATGSFETYDGSDRSYRQFATSAGTVSFDVAEGEEPNYFSLRGQNGAMLVPGASPNVTGWADGFVYARSQSRYYSLDLVPVKAAAPTEAPLHRRLAAVLGQ